MAEKIFYTMGEVAEMFDVNTSLIRHWESQFSILRPKRNKKGNRLFSPQDVEHLKMIYHLVKECGMTLEGAKKALRKGNAVTAVGRDTELMERLQRIRSLLAEVRYNLASLPLDVGVQVSGSMFHREVQSTRSLKFKSLNVLAVADVNIFRARAISIFAGAGFGYALCGETAPVTFDNSQGEWGGFSTGGEKSGICFVPRVGVELFHRLRVTFDYRLQEKANRHFDVTLGFVIGGGRK